MTSTASAPATIGLLLGSLRQGGNNAGLAAWLTAATERLLSAHSSDTRYALQQIFPFPAPTGASDASHVRYPGPVVDPLMAQAVQSASQYQSASVRHWSAVVRSCAAFIVLTPQYNWGYSGELKNALDQLYHEWSGKPCVVVTYGGHGGSRCDDQLRLVMGGGLKMRPVDERVQITLPRQFIAGERRVGDGGDDSFLENYVAALTKAVTALVGLLEPAAVPTTDSSVAETA